MKTSIATMLLLGSMVGLPARQDDPESFVEPAPAIVYEQPVTYEAPVVYEMPVVYYAPVFYLCTPEQMAAMWQPPPPPPPEPCAPSTVLYIGGSRGSYSVTHYGVCTPNVIYFGSGQAGAQGYQFSLRR